MIDKEILNLLKCHEDDKKLDFKLLRILMLDSGIEFINNYKLRGLGFAAYDKIYLNVDRFSNHPIEVFYFVILHEMAHCIRSQKLGKKKLIENLSVADVNKFTDIVVNEETIADRYASYLYYCINKIQFPINWTQQLHLPMNRVRYKPVINELFGKVNNTEESYNDFVNSILN